MPAFSRVLYQYSISISGYVNETHIAQLILIKRKNNYWNDHHHQINLNIFFIS